MFGDYLDPLADEGYRLLLVDMRGHGRSDPAPPESVTLERLAADVDAIAAALDLERYAVLGHSTGGFVALQHAVDSPGEAAQTIISGGIPSARFLDAAIAAVAGFEPEDLRAQVVASVEAEKTAQTAAEVEALMRDQLPLHFADPRDPRLDEYARRSAGTIYRPEVLRQLANNGYGAIEVEDRLGSIREPVLVLVGARDRVCPRAASEAIAAGAPRAELVVLERSGHFTFAEETDRYLDALRDFLGRQTRAAA